MCELRPSFTRTTTSGWNVSDLLGGVDILDLDSRVQVYPVKQPIQVHSVGSRDVSHGLAQAFSDHLDHRIIIFENKERCPLAGDVCVWRNIVNTVC